MKPNNAKLTDTRHEAFKKAAGASHRAAIQRRLKRNREKRISASQMSR